ncbi:hypothetical protein A9W99_18040 [Mycobacterium sp. 1164966.3]|uniref:DUF3618 domain-containing protein n=1 Tax=Mycobacterium sp. 1164966.3 TaxID=1856861 RepID=UPI0008002296|nr:DUF3618 domain-containing protein [Mycobacterium sp. 1164966.3]OBA80013.1 hypothetical protein A9W99_18040 [Mycobacterium sp. 1164966.3]
MTGVDPSRPEPGPEASADDLQADIEKTREQLGETVTALSAKLDVKSRAKQAAAHTKDRLAGTASKVAGAARNNQGSLRPAVPVGVIVAALAVGVVIWIRHR